MTEEEFNKITWPEEFTIRFVDGREQIFVSCGDVIWDSGANEEDKNEGRANISCALKKKSLSQQKYRLVQVWADEIEAIHSANDKILWSRRA